MNGKSNALAKAAEILSIQSFTPSLSQCTSSQEKSAGHYLMCLEMTGCFYVASDLINNNDLQPFLSYCTYAELFSFLDYSVQQLHDSYTASSF